VKKLLFFLFLVLSFSDVPAREVVFDHESKPPVENFSERSHEGLFAIHNTPRITVHLPNLSDHTAFLFHSQVFRLKVQAILASRKLSEDHKSEKRYLLNNYPSHNFW